MAYQFSWLAPKRLLLCNIHDNLSMEEIYSIQPEFDQLLSEGDAPVHIIIDFSTMKDFPKNLSQIKKATKHDQNHPNLGITDPVARFIASVVTQTVMRGRAAVMMEKRDEALRYLHHSDATLGQDAGA